MSIGLPLAQIMRSLFRSPGMTTAAVLTLSLGIGSNAAIFSFFNSLLLRPTPGIEDHEGLVHVGRSTGGSGFDNMSYPNFADYRELNRTLSGIAGYQVGSRPAVLAGESEAETLSAGLVSGNYFDVLNVKPAIGRLLIDADDQLPEGRLVTVLSFGYWKRRFGGDPAVIGKELTINKTVITVVGVASESFAGPVLLQPDAWFPLTTRAVIVPGDPERMFGAREASWFMAVGRMRPGVTLDQVRSDLGAIAAALQRQFPTENREIGVAVEAWAPIPGDFGDTIGAFVGVLQGVVGLLLLIACTNVAGMLLASGAQRRREIAIRLAIGASRRQLVLHLVAEGLVMFIMAGLLSLVAAAWFADVILTVLPEELPFRFEPAFDWRVFGFALAVATLAGTLTTLVSAVQSTRLNLNFEMKGEGTRSRQRLRRMLVVAQVAASVVLLISTGLVLRSLQFAASVDPGFKTAGVDIVDLDLSLAGYNETSGLDFIGRLLALLQAQVGVESASVAADLPLDMSTLGMGAVRLPGQVRDEQLRMDWNVVAPGYFRTLNIPLASGRDFGDGDRAGQTDVAIVSEALAKRLWPGDDPIGRVLLNQQQVERRLQVVGVARDHAHRSIGEAPLPYIYVPMAQWYTGTRVFTVVRTTDGLRGAVVTREIIRNLDRHIPVLGSRSLEEHTATFLMPQRIAGAIVGSFGLIGLLLTAVGIYGVMAYLFTMRRVEIGVRLALGATPRDILCRAQLDGLWPIFGGALIGAAGALAVAYLARSVVLGISPWDLVTFASAAGTILVVAGLSVYLPARRLSRTDPIRVLRRE